MSEERLIRLEDMVGQLIGMVGKLAASQNEMRQDMENMKVELKAEIAGVRTELKAEIAGVRTELKAEIAGVRTELKAEIADVRTEMKSVDSRLTGIESHMFRYQHKVAYLEDKSAEHDLDIHMLKQQVV